MHYTHSELLQLAGKLAITARDVINADALTVSERIKRMQEALDKYDFAIFANALANDVRKRESQNN